MFCHPQEKGYFKAAGLDVTIDEAATPLKPITSVASGNHEMAFADINSLIRYRDQIRRRRSRASSWSTTSRRMRS